MDPDGRYACLRVSRLHQLMEKKDMPQLLTMPQLTPVQEMFELKEQRRYHRREALASMEIVDVMWEVERLLHIETHLMQATTTPAPVLPLMMAYAATSPPRIAQIASAVAAAASAFPDLPAKLSELMVFTLYLSHITHITYRTPHYLLSVFGANMW